MPKKCDFIHLKKIKEKKSYAGVPSKTATEVVGVSMIHLTGDVEKICVLKT